jgi:flagellar basal-body rod modification protein FlgD
MNIQGFSPTITAPLQAQTAHKPAAASSTSGSSSTSSGTGGLSSTGLEGTFLNLLATELQNQDPTSPVDPTQMVGQLVSLNQLDQLISINQTLSNLGGSGSTPTSSSSTAASAQGGAQNELGTPGVGSISQTGPQNELNTPGVGSMSNNSAASHVPSISQALGLFQPGYAAAAGANALMNLYGSFTAPAQTQQLSAGGR